MKQLMLLLILILLLTSLPAAAVQLGEPTPVPVQGAYMSPIWRPDGQGLALAGPGYRGLYFTDLAGNASVISDASKAGWKFAWGPDGELAYRVQQEDGSGMALMVTGKDGSVKQVSPFLNEIYPATWDKDGLTYRSGDELITVDKDGNIKKVRSLSQGRGLLSKIASVSASLTLGHITGTTFAAFGSLLSSEEARQKAGKGVFVDPDNQIWVVDEKGNKKKLIDVAEEHGYFNPIESPDGKYAVSGLSGNLYVADPNGGEPVDLGVGSNPTWSPDGRYLIFQRSTDDGHNITSSDLWYCNADGTGMTQLTDTAGNETSPSWSPDGSSVAYVIDGVVYVAPVE
ncbi:MAG TPA: hypothetical protein VFI02_20325 [Armatimonadota bacterium]|nr:hypothetical protein [Armatimonadota bacterium]